MNSLSRCRISIRFANVEKPKRKTFQINKIHPQKIINLHSLSPAIIKVTMRLNSLFFINLTLLYKFKDSRIKMKINRYIAITAVNPMFGKKNGKASNKLKANYLMKIKK